MSDITWFVTFSVRLTSPSMALSRPVPVVTEGSVPSLLGAENSHSIVNMHCISSSRPLSKDTSVVFMSRHHERLGNKHRGAFRPQEKTVFKLG